jgi:hypothetical protein
MLDAKITNSKDTVASKSDFYKMDNKWWQLYDSVSKRFYYYNPIRKVTSWSKPSDLEQCEPDKVSGSCISNNNNVHYLATKLLKLIYSDLNNEPRRQLFLSNEMPSKLDSRCHRTISPISNESGPTSKLSPNTINATKIKNKKMQNEINIIPSSKKKDLLYIKNAISKRFFRRQRSVLNQNNSADHDNSRVNRINGTLQDSITTSSAHSNSLSRNISVADLYFMLQNELLDRRNRHGFAQQSLLRSMPVQPRTNPNYFSNSTIKKYAKQSIRNDAKSIEQLNFSELIENTVNLKEREYKKNEALLFLGLLCNLRKNLSNLRNIEIEQKLYSINSKGINYSIYMIF